MIATGISGLERSIQKTNEWVKEFGDEIGVTDKEEAFRGLAAGLHTLRDRLPVELSAHLAAQLPMVLKGVYYEGWRPADVPADIRQKSEYMDSLARALPQEDLYRRAEDVAQAVFAVLERHISADEVDKVRQALPKSIREIWPQAA